MTKKELLENDIFQMIDDDTEIVMQALGEHRVRRVRRGKTSRTGDKLVLILDTK